MTPQLLFLQSAFSLMCLYCLDYYLGGERGLSAFKENSVFRGKSQTLSEESKAPNIETFNGTVAMGRVDGTNKTELSFLKEGDSFTHTAARTFLGTYAIMYMLMLMFIFLVICAVMCKKVSQRLRSTNTSRGGEGNNYLIRVLTSLANTRYVGNAAELERLRSTLRLMRREITPEDYETLLALDATEDLTRPRVAVPQSLIDQCPVMHLTQSQIDKMSGGINKKQSEVDNLSLTTNEGVDGSTRSPLHSHDEYACTVCLDEYKSGDVVRTLPCMHQYHKSCIDPWLLENGDCPMCKQRIDNDGHV